MNHNEQNRILDDIQVLPLSGDGDEIALIHELFRSVWPKAHHLTTEYIDWQYNQNPLGMAVGFNAWHRGRIVGHYAAQPLSGQIHGQPPEKGLLSLNTSIHEEYRGKNLFQRLAKSTYKAAVDLGCSFVVGVANQNVTLLRERLLRFQVVCPLQVKIGLGHPTLKDPAPLDFYRCWSDECLNWRINPPNLFYGRASGRDSVLMAATGQFGIWAELIMDYNRKIFEKMPAVHPRNPIRLWIGLDPQLDWRQTLRINLPMRFRQSPLNLVFKDLTDKERQLDPAKVKFSVLDFDAY